MRAVHRAALTRVRSGGGITSASTHSAVRLSVSRLVASWAQPVADDEHVKSGQRQARESGVASVFAHSIAKDIAALEAIRDAYASDAALSATFGRCAERLAQCVRENRRVYVTGMGKSGIVARRLASSLASVSVSSQWVHGGEWIHGELGGLKAGDMVILLSHSGNTSELVSLPKRFQDAGCSVVSVVGDAKSRLANASDFVLLAEAQDDSGCPVPSRSIIAQEALCNALIEHLMKDMGEAAAKLQQNHPGGAIGRFYREVDS